MLILTFALARYSLIRYIYIYTIICIRICTSVYLARVYVNVQRTIYVWGGVDVVVDVV